MNAISITVTEEKKAATAANLRSSNMEQMRMNKKEKRCNLFKINL
jgi:hypothetical protein